MNNLDYESGKKVVDAIDRKIKNVSNDLKTNSPYNRTRFGRVVKKTEGSGIFTVVIDNTTYNNVYALRTVGTINVGDVVICLIPNNNFSNITILGVADGTIASSGGGINEVKWGDIVGTISNQVDLINYLTSNYTTLNTQQEIGGQKIFTGKNTFNNQIQNMKSPTIDRIYPETSDNYVFFDFLDKNEARLGVVGSVLGSDGLYGTYIQAGNEGNIRIVSDGTTVYTSTPTPPAYDNSMQIANTSWVNQFVKRRNMVPQARLAMVDITEGVKTTGTVLYTATQNCFAYFRGVCGAYAGYLDLQVETSDGTFVGALCFNMPVAQQSFSGMFPMKAGMKIRVENSTLTTINWADMIICSVGE